MTLARGEEGDGAVARLAEDSIAVTMQVPPFRTFEAPSIPEIMAQARKLGGTFLGITHAVHPGQLTAENIDQTLHPVFMAGDVVLGWVGLHGTKPRSSRRAAPVGSGTYVVHWNSTHRSVGRLLAHTPSTLVTRKARSWAAKQIGRDKSLIGWELVDDANIGEGWFTLDALSAKQYILRQHDDGWRLVEVISRGGGGLETDAEAKLWAGEVLQFRAGFCDLPWEPGPSTAGSTTLYATT